MQIIFYTIIGLLYLIGFSVLFRWLNHKQGKPIQDKWLITAFVAKVVAGFTYGYVYAHFFPVSDSWMYFKESLVEYHILLTNPATFFSTGIHFNNLTDFFSINPDAAWSNMGENLLIKLLAIFNLFSGGNYYINTILFNCFSFWGLYLIYRVAKNYFQKNSLLVFCIIFFLPSCLFWNSGIDKDGLIVFFTGVLIYGAYHCLSKKPAPWRILVCVISFVFIFMLRNVTALLLVPAIAAWCVAIKVKRKPYWSFIIIYSACIVFFFLSVLLPSRFNMPLKLAEKQHDYIGLTANTVLPLTALQPTFASYLDVLPQAVNHVFLRPYITEIKTPFHLMAFAEIMLTIIFIMITIISARKNLLIHFLQPFPLFLILLSLSGLLLIGYTVPFPGAIIRYKAFYMVLLLIPFIQAIPFNKHKKNTGA